MSIVYIYNILNVNCIYIYNILNVNCTQATAFISTHEWLLSRKCPGF